MKKTHLRDTRSKKVRSFLSHYQYRKLLSLIQHEKVSIFYSYGLAYNDGHVAFRSRYAYACSVFDRFV